MNIDLSQWKNIYMKYNYADSGNIRERIKKKGYYASQEDLDIINQIALWKLNRQVHVDFETIEYLNSIARTIKDPEEAIKNRDVVDLIDDLLKSPGVRLPIASTILKFYQPKAFPIIDQRAYFQLFNEKLPQNAGVETYLQYIKKCIDIGKRYNIPFEKIDEVLYQKDKEEGRKLS